MQNGALGWQQHVQGSVLPALTAADASALTTTPALWGEILRKLWLLVLLLGECREVWSPTFGVFQCAWPVEWLEAQGQHGAPVTSGAHMSIWIWDVHHKVMSELVQMVECQRGGNIGDCARPQPWEATCWAAELVFLTHPDKGTKRSWCSGGCVLLPFISSDSYINIGSRSENSVLALYFSCCLSHSTPTLLSGTQ